MKCESVLAFPVPQTSSAPKECVFHHLVRHERTKILDPGIMSRFSISRITPPQEVNNSSILFIGNIHHISYATLVVLEGVEIDVSLEEVFHFWNCVHRHWVMYFIESATGEEMVIILWAMGVCIHWMHCREDGISKTTIDLVLFVDDSPLRCKELRQFTVCPTTERCKFHNFETGLQDQRKQQA